MGNVKRKDYGEDEKCSIGGNLLEVSFLKVYIRFDFLRRYYVE